MSFLGTMLGFNKPKQTQPMSFNEGYGVKEGISDITAGKGVARSLLGMALAEQVRKKKASMLSGGNTNVTRNSGQVSGENVGTKTLLGQ